MFNYVEGSRHWANLCTFRGTWHRTLCIWVPDVPSPRGGLDTRSNTSDVWSCLFRNRAALSTRSDRWELVRSFCTRAFSKKRFFLLIYDLFIMVYNYFCVYILTSSSSLSVCRAAGTPAFRLLAASAIALINFYNQYR